MKTPYIVTATGFIYSPSLETTIPFTAEIEIPWLSRVFRKIWVRFYDHLIQNAIEDYVRADYPDGQVIQMSYTR